MVETKQRRSGSSLIAMLVRARSCVRACVVCVRIFRRQRRQLRCTVGTLVLLHSFLMEMRTSKGTSKGMAVKSGSRLDMLSIIFYRHSQSKANEENEQDAHAR